MSTGTAETAIHFVIYEHFKKMMMARKQTQKLDLSDCMWIAAVAKLTASSICYPHGERVVLSAERYTCMCVSCLRDNTCTQDEHVGM